MKVPSMHPFPARMAPEIALNSLVDLRQEDGRVADCCVLDPMCGSGTAVSAAASLGCHAIGRDIDPLAVLISKVATTHITDCDFVLKSAESIVSRAEKYSDSAPIWDDDETLRFVSYWFGERQRAQLASLSRQLSSFEEGPTRDVLYLALSRIIDTKTPKASLASDTSHSRPHKTINKSDYDVYSGFIKAVRQLIRRLEKNPNTGCADVKIGDARELDLGDSSVDLIITSPPYLNAIDYMRGHKLSLVWMGYTIPELRHIRSESIGANRKPTEEVDSYVGKMIEYVQNAAIDCEALPKGVIARYAQDLLLTSLEMHRVLKRGSKAVLVVGNSTIRGNYIENDVLTRMSCEQAGFSIVDRIEREIPESSRYLPLKGDSLGKRMRAEVVLTVEKG